MSNFTPSRPFKKDPVAANLFISRFQESLIAIPTPGGNGYHPAILGISNLGVLAGLPAETIFQHIRRYTPGGTRRVSDREIQDAINKALADHAGGTFTPRSRPEPIVKDGKTALQKIIDQGTISDEAHLWDSSPTRLWDEPQHDVTLLLETLYEPTDLIWIGERHQAGIIGETIKTADEWISHFRHGGFKAPHLILNPLSGAPAMKKTGDGQTLRGDGNISVYRYCMIEFDNLSREDQIRFWSVAKLPIVALIDSGGKSIHAWLAVAKLAIVEKSEQWQTEIKLHLYDRILTPLGVDGACSNPLRMSRLPRHYRTEKQAYQRLLWLSGRTGRFIA